MDKLIATLRIKLRPVSHKAESNLTYLLTTRYRRFEATCPSNRCPAQNPLAPRQLRGPLLQRPHAPLPLLRWDSLHLSAPTESAPSACRPLRAARLCADLVDRLLPTVLIPAP